jgi:hypothetical protein
MRRYRYRYGRFGFVRRVSLGRVLANRVLLAGVLVECVAGLTLSAGADGAGLMATGLLLITAGALGRGWSA